MIEILETRPQRDARKRLAEFIQRARYDCAAFGNDLNWEQPDWDVTKYCPIPENKSHTKAVIYFTTHEGGTSKSMAGRTPLSEPFCSLIKAIVRTLQDARPQTDGPLKRLVNAARDLELELADRNYDPSLLLPSDFRAAAQRMKKRASPKTVYRLGQALEKIAAIIDANGISFCRLDWKNPFPRVANNSSRQSELAHEARADCLPDDEVLDALATIWNVVESRSDTILMGAVTLLHCAPWRIIECLRLTSLCEVHEQKVGPSGPVFDSSGAPVMRYGLRYWKEKSGAADIKWIPTVMTDVARNAVARVREATSLARENAKWANENPGRARLPGPDEGPEQLFSTVTIAEMLGLASQGSAMAWLNHRDVPLQVEPYGSIPGRNRKLVRRKDLERALLAEMPSVRASSKEPPLQERLFINFRYEHNRRLGTNTCLLELVTDQHVRDFLGGRPDLVASVFDRLLDRPELKARTHQFRHWLNTLAQAGGLDQGLIARWSGRDDEQQNSEYDHLSSISLAEKVRELFAADRAIGPLADFQTTLPPIDRQAFREVMVSTAHVTDIGFCLQNWNASPCPDFGACATCESISLIKGDNEARARAYAMRNDNAWIAEQIEAEIGSDSRSASQHYAAATAMVSALDRIIAIHDDPSIADGTLVQPNKSTPPHYCGPAIR